MADACAGCPNQAVCVAAEPALPGPDLALIAESLAGVLDIDLCGQSMPRILHLQGDPEGLMKG